MTQRPAAGSDDGDRDFDRDFAEIVAQIEQSRMREPEGGWLNVDAAIDAAEPDEPDPSEWKPAATLPQISLGGGVALALAGYSLVITLLSLARLGIPQELIWSVWITAPAAVVVGLWNLPRHRDDDHGDGAVV